MKELKPTTVAVFIYLQPVFATVFAIGLGKDELNLVKNVGNFDICWCLFGNIPPKH
jgi:drug/metabolite transporter (DMT)-like permease